MLVETHPAAELEAFFNAQCERYLAWARQGAGAPGARDAALAALRFPHEFRSGQRELAVAAYRKARDGGCLLAQAPTGIGKTLGTLFPLLKAAPEAGLDKLFFLAAKAGPRAGAAGAGHAERAAGRARPAVLELQARDKLCEHPDKACHGESCPLARGYDRLPQARAGALAHGRMDAAALRRQVAAAHDVCYYLAQELTRWSDVVVGDYNYYYDATAMLHALTQASQWKVAVLADGRITWSTARVACTPPSCRRPRWPARARPRQAAEEALDGLHRSWQAFNRKQAEPYQAYDARRRRACWPRCRRPRRRSPRRWPRCRWRRTIRCWPSISRRCTSSAWPSCTARTRCSTPRWRSRARPAPRRRCPRSACAT